MKRKILLTAILWLSGICLTYGQSITYDEFKVLIPSLQKEDWKTAFKGSSKLLNSAPKDTSEFHAIVLYINIFSAAGMVSENKMTYKDLEKNVMKFQGQKIIMSAHPVSTKLGAFRSVEFDVSDSTNTAFTAATNSKGISILCFEKFMVKDKINLDDFPEGSFVRCGGTLQTIETNPNRSTIWIMRLTVTDAFARKSN